MRHATGMMLAATCAILAPLAAHAEGALTTRETFPYLNHTIGVQVDAQGNGYIAVMDKNVSSSLKMRDPYIIQVFELRNETVAILRGRYDGCDRTYEAVSLWDGHHMQTDRLDAPCVDYSINARDADVLRLHPMTPQVDALYLYKQRKFRGFMHPGFMPDTSFGPAASKYVPITRQDGSVVENPSDPTSPLSQKWLDDPAAYAKAAQGAPQVAQAPAAPARTHRVVHHASTPVPQMEKMPLSIPHADETDTSQPVKLDLTQ